MCKKKGNALGYKHSHKAVLRKFKNEFSSKNDILDITYGDYHGEDFIIGVTVKWKSKIKLPAVYDGIRVVIFYTHIDNALRKRLGKYVDLYGDIIDVNFIKIGKILLKNGLSFEKASRKELIDVIKKFS